MPLVAVLQRYRSHMCLQRSIRSVLQTDAMPSWRYTSLRGQAPPQSHAVYEVSSFCGLHVRNDESLGRAALDKTQ